MAEVRKQQPKRIEKSGACNMAAKKIKLRTGECKFVFYVPALEYMKKIVQHNHQNAHGFQYIGVFF